MQRHNTACLPNGLRVIHEPSATDVVYCGYTVAAGTRDEADSEAGMAHFCEHMSFKGTSRRRAWQITNGLERVGGDLNAFTTKEETVFYASVLRQDYARAVDLLSDIVFHSIYPQKEIDKEVEVICDEIKSYEDSPSELIFDEFEEMLFRGHPLGRSILGSASRLHTYTTADADRFTSRCYRPDNMVFFVYGRVDFARTLRLLSRATADISPQPTAHSHIALPPYTPETRRIDKHTHQAYVVMGGRGYSAFDNQRIAHFLLNNILGGPGMNSRLNQALREHRGLVYTVESFITTYTDTGEWGVDFGCDTANVERCCKIVSRELQRLADAPLRPQTLAAAKKQLRGQIGISRDNFESYALAMGKAFAHYGHHRDIERLCEQIDAVSADDLQQVAAELFAPSKLTTLIYS